MKVFLKKNITAYSGKEGEEDVVYSAHNQGNICIAKNYTKPVECPQHLVMKANSDAIRSLWSQATAAYKADLSTFANAIADKASDSKLPGNKFTWFVKIMYSYAKSEGISVSTLDIATIRTSVFKSVKSAMDNNYIPVPAGLTEELDETI